MGIALVYTGSNRRATETRKMTTYKHKAEFTVQPEGAPEVRVTIETEGDTESIRRTFE